MTAIPLDGSCCPTFIVPDDGPCLAIFRANRPNPFHATRRTPITHRKPQSSPNISNLSSLRTRAEVKIQAKRTWLGLSLGTTRALTNTSLPLTWLLVSSSLARSMVLHMSTVHGCDGLRLCRRHALGSTEGRRKTQEYPQERFFTSRLRLHC
jgi:hypothetical protein